MRGGPIERDVNIPEEGGVSKGDLTIPEFDLATRRPTVERRIAPTVKPDPHRRRGGVKKKKRERTLLSSYPFRGKQEGFLIYGEEMRALSHKDGEVRWKLKILFHRGEKKDY